MPLKGADIDGSPAIDGSPGRAPVGLVEVVDDPVVEHLFRVAEPRSSDGAVGSNVLVRARNLKAVRQIEPPPDRTATPKIASTADYASNDKVAPLQLSRFVSLPNAQPIEQVL